MRLQRRDIWAVVTAFDRGVLEKIKGRTLLDIAIGMVSSRKPAFGHVYVATHDVTVAAVAKRLNAGLPRRVVIPVPVEPRNQRGSSFHAVDFIVEEGVRRGYATNAPKTIVSIDPFYPFTSFPTLEGVYDGALRCTMSIPVVDVVQGLVMPIWSVFGHSYSPPGTRPHEDYNQFLTHTGHKTFTVQMVRVQSLSETVSCRDGHVLNSFNSLVKNRAFRLSLDIGCETLYVPAGKTWGCYLPVDADFVYDAAHDVRVFRNGGRNGNGQRNEVGHRLLQQADGTKGRPRP